MRIALTGATGLVGHGIARHLLAGGHELLALGRAAAPAGGAWRRWELGDVPDLHGLDGLVHAAFAHVPGRYRGGEGDDPDGFVKLNLEGSLKLFDAARKADVDRIVFMSSRAIYGACPPGTTLEESMRPLPDTLYGKVKRDLEIALRSHGLRSASLRATGVYGCPPPGRAHKWHAMFRDFANGHTPEPRVGTELHVDDLAAAIGFLLSSPQHLDGGSYNLSDVLLDRRDLLAEYARLTGITTPLPDRADPAQFCPMSTNRIRKLGWRPRGMAGLRNTLRKMFCVRDLPHHRTLS